MQIEATPGTLYRADDSVNKIRHHAALPAFKSEQHLRSLRICFDETVTLPPKDVLSAHKDKQITHEN